MDFISNIGGKCRKSPNQILKDFGGFLKSKNWEGILHVFVGSLYLTKQNLRIKV